ncbi:unnamed protein product [Blepharisma stoltei]|uniref:Transmembrane protein n=1 Tax=Blepharisma stoltei TaxID=1481888 RepID=A0AAU9IJY6_9CILI|nr:unnamed protein product [Blepharisma stoltei]
MNWKQKKMLIEDISEELNKARVANRDKEMKEEIIDHMGYLVYMGGRGAVFSYIFLSFVGPLLFKFPRRLIRYPMLFGLLFTWRDLYFFGADVNLRLHSGRILSQFSQLPDGSQLKDFYVQMQSKYNLNLV